MVVHIAEKELKQALITIMALETTGKGITSLSLPKFVLITSILLMMNINHGIEKHVVFVVYITMWLLSAGREWKKERG